MLLNIAINAFAWMVIQLALAFLGARIPSKYFPVRVNRWEQDGRIYELLGIRTWKDKLPDAGRWFNDGFRKRNLRGHSTADLDRFSREAGRGELVHWCAIGALPLFALWNSAPGLLINALYVVLANLPCIVVQRFNRARIARLLANRTLRPQLACQPAPNDSRRCSVAAHL